MQDVWDTRILHKIETFLNRKQKQFPELELNKRWSNHENILRSRTTKIKHKTII